MSGREELVELPENWWRGLKAHISGWMGEIFALAYISRFTPPPGELWALRSSYITSSWRVDYLREGEQLERAVRKSLLGAFLLGGLATTLLPPSRFKLPPGLPREVVKDLERFLAAWVPADEREAAKVLARSELVKKHLSIMRLPPPSEVTVEAELVRALRHIRQHTSGLPVLESPASDFAAFDLISVARTRGDAILLKFESQGLLREVERVFVPEVTVKKASPNLKAGWVIEVEPRDAVYSVALKLLQALTAHHFFSAGGGRIVYVMKGKLFVSKCVNRDELEKALEIVRAEPVRRVERLDLSRRPAYRVRLKGVEVLEVKAGTGRLPPHQVEALRELRELLAKVESAVGRRIELSYKVLRVRFLDPFEVPHSALIESHELN